MFENDYDRPLLNKCYSEVNVILNFYGYVKQKVKTG